MAGSLDPELQAQCREHGKDRVQATGRLAVLDLMNRPGANPGGQSKLVLAHAEFLASAAHACTYGTGIGRSDIQFVMHNRAFYPISASNSLFMRDHAYLHANELRWQEYE
ncbi:MAG TPA: hypothetical protein VFP21_11940 [Solirubrobacterales bacterium]|nr:hypothetical protein [Solirubrobacterales bacterium]